MEDSKDDKTTPPIICPVPLWELDKAHQFFSGKDVSEMFVRTRLFEDDVFAEFTIAELIELKWYRDISSLILQYKKWHEVGVLEWIPDQRVHQETSPFSVYFSETKIPELYLTEEPDHSHWGPVKYWGERRTPRESWELD
ncbi:hypothetical protein [Corynebacterium crudilactis]|uniref:hypothetical protein n=1 Tax=Corynebacterium crudilactis TaxID=1652495 RepID=UPI001471E154|nr:hypothetical protein [Corynebacterium crudilactis]